MKREFDSFVDQLNAGEPIPPVEPEDIRAALPVLAKARAILESAAQRGIIAAAAMPTIGFSLDDLALRCRPDADVFTVGLRAVLASVILPLARTNLERLGCDPDESIIQAIAAMPLLAAELKDTQAILARIGETVNSRTRPAPEN